MRFLVTSISIEDFKLTLSALLNVMLSETDGWTEDKVETLLKTSRRFLLNKIKGIEATENANEEASGWQCNYFENDDDENTNYTPNSHINIFVNEIENVCKNKSFVGLLSSRSVNESVKCFYLFQKFKRK